MPTQPADLDRLLDPAYMEGVGSRSMDELRTARAELQEAEGALSYVRRIVQGRLDIVASERQRRAGGNEPAAAPGGPSDGSVGDLVEHLPGILADSGVRGGIGVGRPPMQLDPGEDAAGLLADLDRQVDPGRLTDLPSLSDGDLAGLTEELAGIERQLSDHRRALHERIDAMQAELVNRYRTGQASVDSLLQ